MTDSWFRNMPPLLPSSIAPVPQDRPPLWSVIGLVALVILALSPFAYVVGAVLGVVP